MSSYQPDSETVSYGEYQATKYQGIKSQIYTGNDISTTLGDVSIPEQTLSKSVEFNQILPVKVLPPIKQESFNDTQTESFNTNTNSITDMNLDLNSFSTNIAEPNTDFHFNDLQPTPTLESIQTSETPVAFGNEITLPETNQVFNIMSQNYDMPTTIDNISSTQSLDVQSNDIVQTFGENNGQIINTENTFTSPDITSNTNMITSDTNLDINTFQTANIDTTTNIDTTANIDTPQTYDSSTFQTTDIAPSYDINNIQETTNIDINTYSAPEPIIDTTKTENFDINALTSETTNVIDTNTNFDINNIQTSEPIVDTMVTTNTNENFDLFFYN